MNERNGLVSLWDDILFLSGISHVIHQLCITHTHTLFHACIAYSHHSHVLCCISHDVSIPHLVSTSFLADIDWLIGIMSPWPIIPFTLLGSILVYRRCSTFHGHHHYIITFLSYQLPNVLLHVYLSKNMY